MSEKIKILVYRGSKIDMTTFMAMYQSDHFSKFLPYRRFCLLTLVHAKSDSKLKVPKYFFVFIKI